MHLSVLHCRFSICVCLSWLLGQCNVNEMLVKMYVELYVHRQDLNIDLFVADTDIGLIVFFRCIDNHIAAFQKDTILFILI
jgi:hypothetical protein